MSQSTGRTSILSYVLPVLWMAAIFGMSSIPGERIPRAGGWDLLVKKGGHMAAYALLALLWRRPLGTGRGGRWLAFAIAVLYAISDEIHQTFVPGRNGTPVDVLVDAAGALIGAVSRWRVGNWGRS